MGPDSWFSYETCTQSLQFILLKAGLMQECLMEELALETDRDRKRRMGRCLRHLVPEYLGFAPHEI